MNSTYKLLVIFVFSFCLISCTTEDYYTSNDVVEKLTNKIWVNIIKDKPKTMCEQYVFLKNGTGYQVVQEYQNKEVGKEKKSYFHWTFMYPDNKVIYIDWGLYWKINSLSDVVFNVEETYDDPYQTPSQLYKRKLEMTSKNSIFM